MPFTYTIPLSNGGQSIISLELGQTIFVVGANGSGKSSLMHRFYTNFQANARRISAHRQTWFSSSAITLSPEQKRSTETNIKSEDLNLQSRWMDPYSSQRATIAIFDLIDAENVRARAIASAVDVDDIESARRLSKQDAPIKVINEMLRLSNVPIEISVRANEEVVASKSGGPVYSVAELSDGERNALLIAAEVLTVIPGSIVLIDEPERHLHRAIISPLLTSLFASRTDCAFIVSTHDVMLSIDNPSAKTLLVRGCTYAGSNVTGWDVDITTHDTGIDEEIRRDILGSRRKLLFIEGKEQSLDKTLYSLIFPGVSIIAKSSCRDVEHTVSSIRESEALHWVRPFGIVDNDRRTVNDIQNLEAKGVYALSVFSVESIYYHPEVQRRVTDRYALVTGDNPATRLAAAKSAAIAAINPHIQRLSERTAEKAVRDAILQNLPTLNEISLGTPVAISVDVASHVNDERDRLLASIAAGDLTAIITQYPVRETSALTEIATKLGFRSREQYEGAVRKLMIDDKDAVEFVQSLFGSLLTDINALD